MDTLGLFHPMYNRRVAPIDPGGSALSTYTSVPLASVGPDGTIAEANPAFVKMVSSVDPDPVGSKVADLFQSLFGPTRVEQLVASGLGGTPAMDLLDKFGYRIQALPVRTPEGNDSVLIECVPRESVKRRAPEASEFTDAHTALPGGPFLSDLVKHETTLSRQFIEHLGFTVDDVPEEGGGNQFLIDRIDPEDLHRLMVRVLTPESDDLTESNVRLLDAEGTYRRYKAYTRTLERTPDGIQSQVVGVFVDLDSILRDLEEERQRVRLLERIVDASDVGVVLTEANGEITAASEAACELFALDEDQLCGRSIDQLLLLSDQPSRSIVHWLTSTTEGMVVSADAVPVLDGGDEHGSNSQAVLVEVGYEVGPEGVLSGLRFLIRRKDRDIELLAKVEHGERLRALGLLTGGIAHDFNNLLMVIFSNVELAKDHLGQASSIDSRVEGHLDSIQNAAEISAANAHRLLDFAHRGAGAQPEVAEPRTCIEEVAKLLLQSAPEHVDVEFGFHTDASVEVPSRSGLESAVFNLALNAVRAESSSVAFAVDEVELVPNDPLSSRFQLAADRYVQVTVADNGTGISEANLTRIFDPFYSTHAEGHGLGLASVYSFIIDAGGAIDVESDLGVGSRFRILLPMSVRKNESADPAPASDLSRTRVLVVDDEPSVLDTTAQFLRSLGCDVTEQPSGTDAVHWFEEHPDEIDVAVVDVRMAGLDGLATATQLRQMRAGLPVVFSSGGPWNMSEADQPYTSTLTKPYSRAELKGALVEAMGGQAPSAQVP